MLIKYEGSEGPSVDWGENAILVLNGYAQMATYPPDVKYVDYFTQFQREAREANRGLWSLDDSNSRSSTSRSSGSSSQCAGGPSGR